MGFDTYWDDWDVNNTEVKYEFVYGNGSIKGSFNEAELKIATELIEIKKPSERIAEAIKVFNKGFSKTAYLQWKLNREEMEFFNSVKGVIEVTKKLADASH